MTPQVDGVGAGDVGKTDLAFAADVRQLFSAHDPMSEDSLLRVAHTDDVDRDPDPEDMRPDVVQDDGKLVFALPDGRQAWIPALLDGRTFTHRLSAVEADHDIIAMGPDLAPMAILNESDTYRRRTDGAAMAEVFPLVDTDVLAQHGVSTAAIGDEGALLLEPGRLAALGVAAGDLVGLRVSGDGFELAAVSQPAPCDIGARLAALLARRPNQPQMLDVAVWTVCADDDSAFRAAASPLGDLLVSNGLVREGDWIALSGFDFAAWHLARRIHKVKERYQLNDGEALAVVATTRLYEHALDVVEAVSGIRGSATDRELGSAVAPFPPRLDATRAQAEQQLVDGPATVRAALELLANPTVATAVLAETDFDVEHSAFSLKALAGSVEQLAPQAARPALRWLGAKACERLGEIEQAEANLRAAESLDASWPLALTSLARYASDRGDAEHAMELLRRAEAPADHKLVVLLEQLPTAVHPGLGSDEQCWCGSGCRYGACHQNSEKLPLAERSGWLYGKVAANLLDGPFAPLLIETAQARARRWDFPDALGCALQDGLVVDAVLSEGGAFADFVATRGSLLPDDERLLAEQWLLVNRSLHVVLGVSRERELTLRDARTGEVHVVREPAGSPQAQVGGLYAARVAPAGDTMQILGGIEPVPPGASDEVMALLDRHPKPVELVTFLSRRFAPPVLHNTDGESLTYDALLRVDSSGALTQALDDAYDRDDDGPDGTRVWFEHSVVHGMQHIPARIELSGHQLHVYANSASRIERVLATIGRLDPSVRVLSDSNRPAGDVQAVRQLTASGPATSAPAINTTRDPVIAPDVNETVHEHQPVRLGEPVDAPGEHKPDVSGVATPRQRQRGSLTGMQALRSQWHEQTKPTIVLVTAGMVAAAAAVAGLVFFSRQSAGNEEPDPARSPQVTDSFSTTPAEQLPTVFDPPLVPASPLNPPFSVDVPPGRRIPDRASQPPESASVRPAPSAPATLPAAPAPTETAPAPAPSTAPSTSSLDDCGLLCGLT